MSLSRVFGGLFAKKGADSSQTDVQTDIQNIQNPSFIPIPPVKDKKMGSDVQSFRTSPPKPESVESIRNSLGSSSGDVGERNTSKPEKRHSPSKPNSFIDSAAVTVVESPSDLDSLFAEFDDSSKRGSTPKQKSDSPSKSNVSTLPTVTSERSMSTLKKSNSTLKSISRPNSFILEKANDELYDGFDMKSKSISRKTSFNLASAEFDPTPKSNTKSVSRKTSFATMPPVNELDRSMSTLKKSDSNSKSISRPPSFYLGQVTEADSHSELDFLFDPKPPQKLEKINSSPPIIRKTSFLKKSDSSSKSVSRVSSFNLGAANAAAGADPHSELDFLFDQRLPQKLEKINSSPPITRKISFLKKSDSSSKSITRAESFNLGAVNAAAGADNPHSELDSLFAVDFDNRATPDVQKNIASSPERPETTVDSIRDSLSDLDSVLAADSDHRATLKLEKSSSTDATPIKSMVRKTSFLKKSDSASKSISRPASFNYGAASAAQAAAADSPNSELDFLFTQKVAKITSRAMSRKASFTVDEDDMSDYVDEVGSRITSNAEGSDVSLQPQHRITQTLKKT